MPFSFTPSATELSTPPATRARRVPSGIRALDEALGGGFTEGGVVLLLGAGAGRDELAVGRLAVAEALAAGRLAVAVSQHFAQYHSRVPVPARAGAGSGGGGLFATTSHTFDLGASLDAGSDEARRPYLLFVWIL